MTRMEPPEKVKSSRGSSAPEAGGRGGGGGGGERPRGQALPSFPPTSAPVNLSPLLTCRQPFLERASGTFAQPGSSVAFAAFF